MSKVSEDSVVTTKQLLVPVSLIAFILALLFAFQTTQVMRDRDALHENKGQQDRPFAESQKLQSQLGALIMGTQKLSEQGNKNAKVIVDKLKEIGVIANQPQAPAGAATEGNPPVPTEAMPEAPAR